MHLLLIVSVFYNRVSLVDQSVQSVVSQLEPGMHLVLVDDGSTDGTLDKLRSWGSDQVSIVSHSNRGFLASIRAGIESAPSKYIAVHGSGDVSLPGRFHRQLEHLDAHPDVVVVGCLSYGVFDVKEIDNPKHVFNKAFDGDASNLLLKGNPFTHGEVMYTRKAYDAVGGYREPFTYAQDLDLWCRMSRHGRFSVLDHLLYVRLLGLPGSVSGTPEKLVLQRYLAKFARHCHLEVIGGQPDPIDRFGPLASLVFSPGIAAKLDVYKIALLTAARGSRKQADRIVRVLGASPMETTFWKILAPLGVPLIRFVLNAKQRARRQAV